MIVVSAWGNVSYVSNSGTDNFGMNIFFPKFRSFFRYFLFNFSTKWSIKWKKNTILASFWDIWWQKYKLHGVLKWFWNKSIIFQDVSWEIIPVVNFLIMISCSRIISTSLLQCTLKKSTHLIIFFFLRALRSGPSQPNLEKKWAFF